jgi:AhpD family alkylhydroperoxidase
MKTKTLVSTFLVLLIAAVAHADNKAQQPSRAAATLAKIEAAMGFVPDFVHAIPASLLPSWWDSAVSFEDSPNTKLDAKTKQLIGLAVAAQIPCEYCIYYHSTAARAFGATQQELQEAVAMAGNVRLNSTILNGMQVDRVRFRRDVERAFRAMRAAKK